MKQTRVIPGNRVQCTYIVNLLDVRGGKLKLGYLQLLTAVLHDNLYSDPAPPPLVKRTHTLNVS